MSIEQDDPFFEDDLLASRPSVERVSAWLAAQKLGIVTVPPIRIRPSAELMGEYSDHGDVLMQSRIEVKHRRKLDFHSVESFPYTWPIVDVARLFDRDDPPPLAYFICNRDLSGAMLIYANTVRKYQRRVERFDRERGRMRLFVEAPRECFMWRDLSIVTP